MSVCDIQNPTRQEQHAAEHRYPMTLHRMYSFAYDQPFYFAVQGTVFQAEPSESFLKCVIVANGWVRYCGSSTIFVTTSHGPPAASERTLKYSVTTASALYGTPFLRKYPARMWFVTAFNVVPCRPRPGIIQRATECPCHVGSPAGGCEAPKWSRRVCVPASVSIRSVFGSCHVM